jgi:hypothetical protein
MGDGLKVVFEPNYQLVGEGILRVVVLEWVEEEEGGMSRENRIVLKLQTWTGVMRALLLLVMEGGKD